MLFKPNSVLGENFRHFAISDLFDVILTIQYWKTLTREPFETHV